jgi:hypothetical protein
MGVSAQERWVAGPLAAAHRAQLLDARCPAPGSFAPHRAQARPGRGPSPFPFDLLAGIAGLVRTAEGTLTVLRQASQPLGPMGAEWLERQERGLDQA